MAVIQARNGYQKPFKGGKREGIVEGIHVIEFELAYSNHDNFFKE